jgi:hypothetical protein
MASAAASPAIGAPGGSGIMACVTAPAAGEAEEGGHGERSGSTLTPPGGR